MKRLAAIFCVAGAVVMPVLAGTDPPAHAPAAAATFPQQFGILLTRSIFARDGLAVPRGPDAPGSSAPTTMPTTMPAGLVLRGIVLDSGDYTAILEDPTTHQIQRVKEGGALAGGNVVHLTLRGFEYAAGGNVTQVAMGHNLHGEIVAPPVVPPPVPPGNAVAKNSPPPPGNAAPGDPAGGAIPAGMRIEGAVEGDVPLAANAAVRSHGKPVN